MITVIPMPVFPYPAGDLGLGSGRRADLRAADADRDIAADILCAAVADGRLTLAELDERLEQVLSAHTIREIAKLISDLSRPGFSGPAAAAVRRADRPRLPASGHRPPGGSRWSLLQSLLAPASAS